jgi:peptide/nickel transport system substrate-binding protein
LIRRLESLIAAILVGVAPVCQPVCAADSVLRVRLNADILSSEPGARRDENTDAVLMHVVEGLVAYREDTSVGPMLAARWDISPDGRTFVFHLRDPVRFHNGELLTADDVVWSIRRLLLPATHWRCLREFDGGGLAKILAVEALDPRTVAITLDRASPMLLRTMARIDCGGTPILARSSVNSDGSWRLPVGTGPFLFSAWKRNQYVELTRFKAYAALPTGSDGLTGGKHPDVNSLRFLVIPDSATAEAALLRGNLDVLPGLLPLEATQLQDNSELRLDIRPSMVTYALLFQTRDPVLRDRRLRQAIALTVDVRGLADAVSHHTAQPNRSVVPVASPYHNASQSLITAPDIAKARQLARAAGYTGQVIHLIASHHDPTAFDSAVLLQAMARQAGINLQIDTLDWAAQLDRYNHGAYQAMTFAYSSRLDPALNFDSVIGDKDQDPRKPWDSPAARALLLQVKSSSDAARQARFDELNALFLDDVPAIVLFNAAQVVAARSTVVGFKGWPAVPRFWGVRVQ